VGGGHVGDVGAGRVRRGRLVVVGRGEGGVGGGWCWAAEEGGLGGDARGWVGGGGAVWLGGW